MRINKQKEFDVPTRRVVPGEDKCYYLKALYSTLVHFRPKTCLEIGTHRGDSTSVFQRYFDEYMPDGLLVTCDIKEYVDLSRLKNVRQIIVSHHTPDIFRFHNVSESDLKFSSTDSVKINTSLIKNESQTYDFAFIDGDHTRESFLRDLEICESVLNCPKTILIDDTKEPVHECKTVYEKEIKSSELYDCYDFEDWDVFVGCSLVSRRGE
jgi:predicted O-methyltransferase YrrM